MTKYQLCGYGHPVYGFTVCFSRAEQRGKEPAAELCLEHHGQGAAQLSLGLGG